MIEINNLTRFRIDKKFCTGVAKKMLKSENKGIQNLSIAFVSALEMQKLNKKYRKKNKPTDVLAFEQINEVVICPKVVKGNAEKFGISFKKELARILTHGILHLHGYEHEKSAKAAKIMQAKEENYLNKYFK